MKITLKLLFALGALAAAAFWATASLGDDPSQLSLLDDQE